jgi:hypothetical protein
MEKPNRLTDIEDDVPAVGRAGVTAGLAEADIAPRQAEKTLTQGVCNGPDDRVAFACATSTSPGEGSPNASPESRATPCVRRSEWVLWAFLVYAAILAWVAPLPQSARANTIVLNLTLLASYALLVFREKASPHQYLSLARDWLPLLLTLLAYREMGWFALPHTSYSLEARWVVWDHAILRAAVRRPPSSPWGRFYPPSWK